MSGDLYELVALGMRYFFAGIMALIVARAWKITVVDSRRAARLRRYAPETGLCGEFLVVSGDGRRARDGMRYPVIREGLVGSSRKADVRVRSASVRRAHAFFERTGEGLRVRAQGRARMYSARGEAKREMVMGDGDHITFGKVELMLVLTDGQAAPGRDARAEGLFDVAEPPRRKPAAPREADELDDWDAPPRKKAARKRDAWDPPIPQRSAAIEPDEIFDSWDDAPKRGKGGRNDDDLFDI